MPIVLSPTLVLYQTSAQTFTSSSTTPTAVTWNSAEYNSGPASWWSAGAPSEIVMPHPGQYYFTVQMLWDEGDADNDLGNKWLYLNESTTVSLANAKASNSTRWLSNTEESAGIQLCGVINVPSGGTVYKVTAMQNSGGSIATESDHGYPYICFASFTYLRGFAVPAGTATPSAAVNAPKGGVGPAAGSAAPSVTLDAPSGRIGPMAGSAAASGVIGTDRPMVGAGAAPDSATASSEIFGPSQPDQFGNAAYVEVDSFAEGPTPSVKVNAEGIGT